jgi:16S rRNA (uracil1498-N3)-methyltransferase
VNLILFEEHELKNDVVVLQGRRAKHIRDTLRSKPDDVLKVGMVDGLMGSGFIRRLSGDEENPAIELDVALDCSPPEPLPLKLFLALPRPKFLKRTLQTIATLGVKDVYLINSARVEKIYWSCEQIGESSIRDSFLLGLEQSRDTKLPRVHLRRLFKPFVEDELPGLIDGRNSYVAHPPARDDLPRGQSGNLALAVGPEGGFIPYEIEHFVAAGFNPVTLGPRILKVETAVTALVSRLC